MLYPVVPGAGEAAFQWILLHVHASARSAAMQRAGKEAMRCEGGVLVRLRSHRPLQRLPDARGDCESLPQVQGPAAGRAPGAARGHGGRARARCGALAALLAGAP